MLWGAINAYGVSELIEINGIFNGEAYSNIIKGPLKNFINKI
jgi:hypothetical protein